MDARAVVADVARLGPFFAVGTGRDPGPGFRPVGELWSDPAPLRERIVHVGRLLGADDRVAASIAFQGLAAGLVSAPFAAAVAHRIVPRFAPDTLFWRPVPSGPWPLWCRTLEVEVVAGPGQAAEAIESGLLCGLVKPLAAAVRAQARVAERVLWGNAASAVAAAKRLLVVARPELAGQAAVLARLLLTRGVLAGTGRLLPAVSPDVGWSFRRRSCCLYYRVPGGGRCDDCVLHDLSGRGSPSAGRGGRPAGAGPRDLARP